MANFLLALTILLLSACAAGNGHNYLTMKNIPAPTQHSVAHCYGYGCNSSTIITVPQETETKLQTLFTPALHSAEEERIQIARAIQIFEQSIGAIAGTNNDVGGTFKHLVTNDVIGIQLDCIDESTNTTSYLTYLDNHGWLRFHRPAFPVNRHPLINGNRWWHQSATIEEIDTQARYAVDSWQKDNGELPYIVPLAQWKKGHDASWDKMN